MAQVAQRSACWVGGAVSGDRSLEGEFFFFFLVLLLFLSSSLNLNDLKTSVSEKKLYHILSLKY